MWLPMFWTKLKRVGNRLLRGGLWLALLAGWGWSLGGAGSAIAAPRALSLGVDALQQQHYEAAAQYFDRAIDQGQALDDAYGYRCVTLLLLNQPQLAVASCNAVIAVNSAHHQAYFYRGLAEYRLGQFEAAIASLNKHLGAHPEDARAYYNGGLARFAQGDIAGAIGQYHQALSYAADLDPMEMSNLYNDLGVAYAATGKPDEAKFALDQAVSLDATDPRAYFNRGCICHHQRQYAAALKDFDQALAIAPDYAEIYLNRGLVKQQLGNLNSARQDYQTASEQFQQQGNPIGAQRARLWLQRLQHPHSTVG